MKKDINFDLSKIADGGLQEKFEHELRRVLDNILNPNTDAKKARKITLTISLSAKDDNRSQVDVDTEVKSRLQPENGVSTTVMIGNDPKRGTVANELKSGIPGQTYIDDDGQLRDDIGEHIDKDGNVIKITKKEAK